MVPESGWLHVSLYFTDQVVPQLAWAPPILHMVPHRYCCILTWRTFIILLVHKYSSWCSLQRSKGKSHFCCLAIMASLLYQSANPFMLTGLQRPSSYSWKTQKHSTCLLLTHGGIAALMMMKDGIWRWQDQWLKWCNVGRNNGIQWHPSIITIWTGCQIFHHILPPVLQLMT